MQIREIFDKRCNTHGTVSVSDLQNIIGRFSMNVTSSELAKLIRQYALSEELDFEAFYDVVKKLEREKKIKIPANESKSTFAGFASSPSSNGSIGSNAGEPLSPPRQLAPSQLPGSPTQSQPASPRHKRQASLEALLDPGSKLTSTFNRLAGEGQ